MNRRRFAFAAPLATAAALTPSLVSAQEPKPAAPPRRANRIGVSTYSFWGFNREDLRPIPACLERAAEFGFDGVELLQMQMKDTSPAALRDIKRRAYALGLDLMGLSTHQGFVSPEEQKRTDNILKTTMFLEQAYDLGIPCIRVNTGRWGTSKDFDELMKNRGIEPKLEGYTEDEGFKWVIDSFE